MTLPDMMNMVLLENKKPQLQTGEIFAATHQSKD